MKSRGPQSPTQADFVATLDDGYHHHVGNADPADQQGDGAQTHEEVRECAGGRDSSR